jgi:hypothetical protein
LQGKKFIKVKREKLTGADAIYCMLKKIEKNEE